jgi:hypothetical protein
MPKARSAVANIYSPTPAGTAYTTNFPLTENPISEGGKWTGGRTVGIDWEDPKTTGGQCVGSMSPTVDGPTRYSDDIAILNTSVHAFTGNQWAQATVYLVPGYTGNGGSHEIELLLDFSITANDAHGYEVLWGIAGYIAVVRWNGAVTGFTAIYDPGLGSIPVPQDGDVLRAEKAGNFITIKRNNVFVATADLTTFGGTVYNAGQPGLGFWPVDGAIKDNMGWKNWSAGDL